MLSVVTREEFGKTQAVSFSRLSALASSPRTYLRGLEESKDSLGLTLGSLIDTMITEPEKVNDRFYIMRTVKPPEMMARFVEQYVVGNNIDAAIAHSGYKIGKDTIMKKFESEGRAYYNALQMSSGKHIVDVEMRMTANEVVNSLQKSDFTRKYFTPENSDIEILTQVPIIWEFNALTLPDRFAPIKMKAKSLLDIVYIDHRAKTIEPIDLKTGAEGFMKSYWKYRLYIQGSMYKDALVITKNKVDYRVLNTKFIYADTTLFNKPVVYKMTDDDLVVGRSGYKPVPYKPIMNNCSYCEREEASERKYKYKGYILLASELHWHKTHDKWDYSYDLYQSKGEIDIDSFSVKL